MKKVRQVTTKTATVGVIVAVQMDQPDAPHPNAVLGVAFKVANETMRCCLVATVHAIFVKDGKKISIFQKVGTSEYVFL
jgi:hypothetical protein